MKFVKRKIVIWSFTFIMLIACISTSTYAWFQLNEDGWISEFDFNIDSDEGLYISVDGYNYSESISNKQIISAIVHQTLDSSFNKKGELIVDGTALSNDDILKKFNEIELNPITYTNEGGFTDYYNKQIASKDKMYYSFELFFKVDGKTNDEPLPVEFIFDEDDKTTKIESESVDYIYRNKFTTYDKTTFEAVEHSPAKIEAPVESSTESSYEPTYINPTINVNAKDAMRFSTCSTIYQKNDNDEVQSVDYGYVYELYEGLGSYATDVDSSQDKENLMRYDSRYNAGFTLLNASLATPLVAMPYNKIPSNLASKYNWDDKYDTACYLYKEDGFVQSVMFNIWLEGYDADCFNGIGRSKLNMSFAFRKGGEE